MELVAAYECSQEDSEPACSPVSPYLGSSVTAPESIDDHDHQHADKPECNVQQTSLDLELTEHASHAEERRRLRRQVRTLHGHLHILQDEVCQADAELAREKRHTDFKIVAALQKLDSKIVGYSQGRVVYEKKPTAREQHFERYGTHNSIGPGPYALGSWIDWGSTSRRSPTQKEVADWMAKRKAKEDAAAEASARRKRELSRPLPPGEAARILTEVAWRNAVDLRVPK